MSISPSAEPLLGTLARRNDRLMVAGVLAYAALVVFLVLPRAEVFLSKRRKS